MQKLTLGIKKTYQQPPISTDFEHSKPIERGTAPIMANQFLSSGKFVGTIDNNGRMVMRELADDEVITTVDQLPNIISSHKINVNVLSKIAMNASQQLYAATYGLRPTDAPTIAQGEWYER